ncbi:MAG TPA: glycosyltransferase [Gemmatimonadaceae bacterium]
MIAPAQFGGLERVVAALAGGLASRGHRISAISLSTTGRAEAPVLSQLRDAGVNVLSVELPPRSYRGQYRVVQDALKTVKPDVAHSHGYLADVLLGVGRGRADVPIATTVHGFTGGDRKNRLYEWLQIRSHRRFDAVVAVSRPIESRLNAAGVCRTHVLRNAWAGSSGPIARDEARRALQVPPNVFNLGWVGRISREKGLDVLIQALPLLSDLPVHLTVIGDGAERARVEATANALGVSDRITWSGVVADAGRYFHAFDSLVLSSRTEGTPVTLLEAMGACVPIVTAAVGGIPDVVSPAEARLVPSEDPVALAQAIRSVVDDNATAVERAGRAHGRLQSEFSLAPWLDGYERIYESLKSFAPSSPVRVTP